MDPLEAAVNVSAVDWETLTTEQLQDMARGGLAAGELGAGAHREIERRAREHAEFDREENRRAAIHKIIAFGILLGVAIAVLVAADALMFFR
jgi:hypothetical protein